MAVIFEWATEISLAPDPSGWITGYSYLIR
jgi:hypothetical protein